jgi:hypothetical protein
MTIEGDEATFDFLLRKPPVDDSGIAEAEDSENNGHKKIWPVEAVANELVDRRYDIAT